MHYGTRLFYVAIQTSMVYSYFEMESVLLYRVAIFGFWGMLELLNRDLFGYVLNYLIPKS